MIYSEKQYKELEEKLKKEINKLKKDNEITKKENRLLKQQNKQKDEVIHDLDRYDYRGQCQSQKIEIKNLKKKVKDLEEKLGIARTSLGKNSQNSCKPSSTDGFKKQPQNNRVKSGNKPGRKKGHERSAPKVSANPDKIVKVSKVATCTCGCKTKEIEEVARDLIWIEVIVHTTQYVGKKTKCPCCNKEYQPKFPNNVKSIINYDEGLKALVVYLNSYCNVPNQKTTEILGLLSDGKIKMSQGTVGNIMHQFSKKSQKTLESIKKEIMKQPVINEDETPVTVNGKIMSAIGVFTKKLSLVDAFENRKIESFKEMGILDKYIGTVCHDHNPIHKTFTQSQQAECNFHILRYCKGEYEVHKREVIKDFMNHLLELRDKTEIYKMEGKEAFGESDYLEGKQKYLDLANQWKREFLLDYEKGNHKYYDSERCLITRLIDYVDDHLRFTTDFRIDFTNNLAERGLRKIKTKLKIAGGFRKLEFCKYYCNAISIIDTCKKQNMNIGETLKNIFLGQKKIFAF